MKNSLTFLLVFILTGCASKGGRNTSSDERGLTLVFSANRHSELEPCGCSMNPLGGATREWNYLQSIKDRDPLYLVGGATFVPSPSEWNPKILDHYIYKAPFVAEAMAHFGVHAVGISADDLWIGPERLRELARVNHLHFISSNIMKKGAPIFPTYWQGMFRETPVLVLGLTELRSGGKVLPGVSLQAPETALEKIFAKKELFAARPMVFLVSDISETKLRAILKKFPGIHIALGSQTYDAGGDMQQYGASQLYFNPDNRGRALYDVHFGKDPAQGRFYNPKVAGNIAMATASFRKDLDTARMLSSHEAKSRVKQIENYLQMAGTVPQATDPGVTPYEYRAVILGREHDAKDDSENPLAKLIERYKNSVREMALNQ